MQYPQDHADSEAPRPSEGASMAPSEPPPGRAPAKPALGAGYSNGRLAQRVVGPRSGGRRPPSDEKEVMNR